MYRKKPLICNILFDVANDTIFKTQLISVNEWIVAAKLE